MKTPDMPQENPPTPSEVKQEDQFEKELVDRDKSSPLHLNVYIRTLLGGLLFFGLIFFYIRHTSREGHLGTYGQTTVPVVETPSTHP